MKLKQGYGKYQIAKREISKEKIIESLAQAHQWMLRFNELHRRTGLSKSVLSPTLKELIESGDVEKYVDEKFTVGHLKSGELKDIDLANFLYHGGRGGRAPKYAHFYVGPTEKKPDRLTSKFSVPRDVFKKRTMSKKKGGIATYTKWWSVTYYRLNEMKYPYERLKRYSREWTPEYIIKRFLEDYKLADKATIYKDSVVLEQNGEIIHKENLKDRWKF